jgi:hypothetical protein
VLSRSKTKNFDRLTSESSSSPRVITGSVRCDDPLSAGATAADALPAIAKDIPAAPHTGKAFLERFFFEACFARAIFEPPLPASKMLNGSLRLALLDPPWLAREARQWRRNPPVS